MLADTLRTAAGPARGRPSNSPVNNLWKTAQITAHFAI